MIEIRKHVEADRDQIWEIIRFVISTGDTYYFAPDSSKEKMLDYWFDKKKIGYVAILKETPATAGGNFLSEPSAVADGLTSQGKREKIGGIFYITQNFPDLASHIANAAYMVSTEARGKGIGRKMAKFSIEEARKLGFKAMQFNFVVKSNENAVKLWKSLGFEIIGEIPEAFQQVEQGLTNALIMHRKL
jgi:ribosomal protein S18 acetylase RimI-like enzyme